MMGRGFQFCCYTLHWTTALLSDYFTPQISCDSDCQVIFTRRRGTQRNARVDIELEKVPRGRAVEINDPGSGVFITNMTIVVLKVQLGARI